MRFYVTLAVANSKYFFIKIILLSKSAKTRDVSLQVHIRDAGG